MESSNQTTFDTGSQLVTFKAGDLFFGINVLEVQEIIRFQSMTPVPLAPKSVKGLINLRGQMIPAVDLRCVLGLGSNESKEPPMNVVVATGNETISLLVDAIGDVVEVDPTDYEPVPETVSPQMRHKLQGIFKLKDHLLLVLNCNTCLEE